MGKYKTKINYVDAFQWKEGEPWSVPMLHHPDDSQSPAFVKTKDNTYARVLPGNYVLTHQDGSHSVMKADLFEADYEIA